MEWLSPHAVLCGIAICSVLAGQSLGFRQDPSTATDTAGNELTETTSRLRETPTEQESEGNAYESAQRSLEWLTKSMQRVTDKLDSMSKTMDPSASHEEIESELRKAVREAFSELSPAIADPNVSTSDSEKRTIPSIPKARTGRNRASVRKQAEVSDSGSTSFQILNGAIGSPRNGDASEGGLTDDYAFNKPLVGENAPSWVRERIVSKTRLKVPIASSLFESIDECRKDIDQRLMDEVQTILVQNGFGDLSTTWPSNALTVSYIREHFLANSEFDNIQERPSGTYHQLWVLLDIDDEQLSYLKHWERQTASKERAVGVVLTTIAIVASIASFSAIVGFISHREGIRARMNQA